MHLPPMRPELELMLRCARNWPDEVADARIRELLAGPMDWEFLLRIADRHRMKPFLYWNLKELAGEQVPPPAWDQLQARFMANARGNLLAMGRMLRLLAKFEEAGIPVIAFKGPVSTYHLYGTPGLREFVDLDLLVSPEDVPRTSQLLTGSGIRPSVALNANQMKALVRFRNELPYSGNGLIVDLHWKLLYQCYDITVEHRVLWEQSVEVPVEGRPVRTLTPADFLYYLSMRAAIDCWSSIYRLVDLAVALNTMCPTDVRAAIQRSAAASKGRVMTSGLILLHELLGVSVTDVLPRDNCPDRTTRRLANQVVRRLILTPESQPGLIHSRLIGFRVLQCPRDKACILLWLPLSPGPRDIKLVSLPESLYSFYRLVRVSRASLKLAGLLSDTDGRDQP